MTSPYKTNTPMTDRYVVMATAAIEGGWRPTPLLSRAMDSAMAEIAALPASERSTVLRHLLEVSATLLEPDDIHGDVDMFVEA